MFLVPRPQLLLLLLKNHFRSLQLFSGCLEVPVGPGDARRDGLTSSLPVGLKRRRSTESRPIESRPSGTGLRRQGPFGREGCLSGRPGVHFDRPVAPPAGQSSQGDEAPLEFPGCRGWIIRAGSHLLLLQRVDSFLGTLLAVSSWSSSLLLLLLLLVALQKKESRLLAAVCGPERSVRDHSRLLAGFSCDQEELLGFSLSQQCSEEHQEALKSQPGEAEPRWEPEPRQEASL